MHVDKLKLISLSGVFLYVSSAIPTNPTEIARFPEITSPQLTVLAAHLKQGQNEDIEPISPSRVSKQDNVDTDNEDIPSDTSETSDISEEEEVAQIFSSILAHPYSDLSAARRAQVTIPSSENPPVQTQATNPMGEMDRDASTEIRPWWMRSDKERDGIQYDGTPRKRRGVMEYSGRDFRGN